MLALAMVQVIQRAASHDPAVLTSIGPALQHLSTLPLDRLNFPVMSTILSHKYSAILDTHHIPEDRKHKVLLESLLTFLNIIQASPEHATEATLGSVVELVAGQQPKNAVVYPAINYRANLLKVFKPGHVAAVDLEPLTVIVYRGELLGGGVGPERWGLAYTKEGSSHVILETGEYVVVPENSLTLASTKDYDTNELPPYLLACAKIFLPSLFASIYGQDQPMHVLAELAKILPRLGEFTSEPTIQFADSVDLDACENVIDSARWRMDDRQKEGAIKTVQIGKSTLQVVVVAQQATIRPYIAATLVQADTNDVLLRLDTPREFSSKGVYLFPVADKSTGLVVI
jgi:hypothetical protein